jgi:hypothetical protein
MMNELAGAIDVNFPGQVKVYFCEEQLVMVITDQDAPVLSSSCMLVRKRR